MNPSFRLFSGIVLFLLTWSGLAFSQSKGFDVISYHADLTILRADTSIDGSVTMTARAETDLDKVLQHAKYLTIDSVLINGKPARQIVFDTVFEDGRLFFTPEDIIPSGSIFTMKTYYHGKGMPEAGPSPWGGIQHDGYMMYAMGVGFHAPYISCTRHWLPCYDLPDDKADSVILTFITDTADIIASNGISTIGIEISHSPRHGVIYEVHHPIATYLLTFAIGDLEYVRTQNPKNILFETYALSTDTSKVSLVMSKRVVSALVYFDSLFAPYPFEKVGYVVAKIGSMEHQTMITLTRQALDTNGTTAVHELAHMWWGDWVTCKDFNDPWLNEGFATYCEALFKERFFGKAEYWKSHKGNVSAAITSGSSIPLYGTPLTTKPASNYPTGVLYNKGAAVLGMLRYFIGDSLFFASVREYGKRHAYGVATSFDLEKAFEDVTGQDLGWFFKRWVFGTSYPKLRVNWSRKGNGNEITVNFEDTSKGSYFRLPLVIEALTKSGQREQHTVILDSIKYSEATFTTSFVPDSLIVDPDGAVIKRLVGRVTLGVTPESIGPVTGFTDKGIYLMSFSPNPLEKQQVTLTLSPAPAVYRADLPSSVYANRQMAELTKGQYSLAFYDSNGRQVAHLKLKDPLISSSMPTDVDAYSYAIDTSGLNSGTYLAVILFENSAVAGHGRLVVQR